MAIQPIYQFYAELDGYKPLIWRRFQVAGNITVARLGYIAMTLFEMTASHLFSVEVPLELVKRKIILHYEVPSEEEDFYLEKREDFKLADATANKLHHVSNKPGTLFVLNYDFGDDWIVAMRLEQVFKDPELPGGELPRVLEGAGLGIVEDCGGADGLEELTKAFQKKSGKSYQQFRDWLGVDDLDLATFDINDMNFRLKKIPKIYKQCYEDRIYPTQRSIDLIERKYLKK
jgi:hypothetical protein